MSNLPHPLGDTNPGDLFYPGSPDVVASDAPGAAGSRAVEFGEDGLSSAVNRAVYALAKNDEYQEERLEEEIARPDLVTFTPAGGNGGNYTFSARVWCGDTFYLPEDQSMREALISVLDTRYNDLIDPATGDKIVVKEILSAPAGVTKVGTGFFTNPYITFRKMHPVTGALGADYVIPDGTKVWLAFGRSATLDTLTTDTNVRDAWFRGFTRSVGEIHAASFLHDGSRPMSGHLNINAFSLLNAVDVESLADTDLTLYGTGAGHVNLLSDSGMIRFRDGFMPSYLPLNDGDTGLLGDYTSLLTSLNSKTRVAQAFFANRCLDRTGSFTTNDGTGQIDWPELHVCINGEARTIAAGNILATSGTNNVLVVNNTGTVVNRAANAVQTTDIPIFSYYYTPSVFSKTLDIRWIHRKNDKAAAVTIGDVGVGGNVSCDFNAGQLREALELVCLMSWATAVGGMSHRPELQVIGRVTADDTVGKYTLWAPIKITGCGGYNSVLSSSEILGDTVDFIDCDGHAVIMENIGIMHSGDEQTAGLAAIKNAGTGSRFFNMTFRKDPGTYDVGFNTCFAWDQAAANVTIQQVYVEEARGGFVMGSSADLNTAYLTNSTIRDCQLYWGGSAYYGIVVNGDGNSVENVVNNLGLDQYFIVGGNETLISHCQSDMLGAAGPDEAHVFYKPLISAGYGMGMVVRDCHFKRSAGYGIKPNNINDTLMVAKIHVHACHFSEVNKPFGYNLFVAVHSTSTMDVGSCYIYDTADYVMRVNNMWQARFHDNVCAAVGGEGIVVEGNGGCIISNNFFEGWGAAGVYYSAVHVMLGIPVVNIINNVIGATGIPGGSTALSIRRKCLIQANVILANANVDQSILLYSYEFNIIDWPAGVEVGIINNQITGGIYGVRIIRGGATYSYYNGSRIVGNHFAGQTGIAVWVEETEGVVVEANEFIGMQADGVIVRGTGATGAGQSCQIVGNKFKTVEGRGSGIVVGILNQGGGGCDGCMVVGNTFQECGTTDSTTISTNGGQTIIFSNAGGTVINNNIIKHLWGGNNPGVLGDVTNGILLVGAHGTVVGNLVYKNFSVANAVAQWFHGIRINGAENLVASNMVDFNGVQSTTYSDYVYAIRVGGDGQVVNGNMVRGQWARSSGSWIDTAAISIGGNYTSIMGNYTTGNTNHNIYVGTGTNNIALGNVAQGTATVNWGGGMAKPTGNAYNASGLLVYQNLNVNATNYFT